MLQPGRSTLYVMREHDLLRLPKKETNMLDVILEEDFRFERKHEAMLFQEKKQIVSLKVEDTVEFADESAFYDKMFSYHGIQGLNLENANLKVSQAWRGFLWSPLSQSLTRLSIGIDEKQRSQLIAIARSLRNNNLERLCLTLLRARSGSDIQGAWGSFLSNLALVPEMSLRYLWTAVGIGCFAYKLPVEDLPKEVPFTLYLEWSEELEMQRSYRPALSFLLSRLEKMSNQVSFQAERVKQRHWNHRGSIFIIMIDMLSHLGSDAQNYLKAGNFIRLIPVTDYEG